MGNNSLCRIVPNASMFECSLWWRIFFFSERTFKFSDIARTVNSIIFSWGRKKPVKIILKIPYFLRDCRVEEMLFLEKSKYLKGLLNIATCPADRGIDFSNAWKNLPGVLYIDYTFVNAVDWPVEEVCLHLSCLLHLETGSSWTGGVEPLSDSGL